MPEWEIFTGETTVGNLRIMHEFHSPERQNTRDIYVYLPPSYPQSEQRYPVLYMQDGQNLFDEVASHSGEWHVDETMEVLSNDGLEAIVVGIANTGEGRFAEYSPFHDRDLGGGEGDAYLAFIVNTLKPRIDNDFRTRAEREYTGIMGSSLGGLISLYGFFRHADTFGFVGAMSPSVDYADGALLSYVAQAPYVDGRIYVDAGTRELGMERRDRIMFGIPSRRYLRSVRRLVTLLEDKGYRRDDNLYYIEAAKAVHQEAAWAQRLPNALDFLLPKPFS